MGAYRSYQEKISKVEAASNVLALLSSSEKQQEAMLGRIRQRVKIIGSQLPEKVSVVRDMKVLSGVLIWNAHQKYPERLWEAKKHLRQIDEQIKINQRLYQKIMDVKAQSPMRFASFSNNLSKNSLRIEQYLNQISVQKRSWEKMITKEIHKEIDEQIAMLDHYVSNASYGLTFLLDKSLDKAVFGENE